MFKYAGRWLMAMMALVLCMSAASAQQSPRPPAFSQQELDRMLAPIALYPDSLLSQILMAATYPRDVEDAARWSRDNADLNGDRAVRAVERYDWDPSVKSLVAFPQILDMMYDKIEWTADLGDAFLDQQAQVMDTVQYLRRQAYTAGNLRSSEQMRVEVRDGGFAIDFVNPEYVYVPYYDPLVIYGRWWWPTRPVYWSVWSGYHVRPGYAYAWGPAIPVSRGFFYSAPDWRARRINIVNVNNYYYRAPSHVRNAPANIANAPHVWQHDNNRRRDFDRNRAANPAGVHVQAAPAPNQPAQPQAARNPEQHRFEQRGGENRGERRDGRFDGNDRAPQSATASVTQPQVAPSPQQPAAPSANNGDGRRFEQRGAENRREQRDGRFDRTPQAAATPQPQVAPAPQAAPAPQPAAPSANNGDGRRFEQRGAENRREQRDGRFDRAPQAAATPQPQIAPAPQPAAPSANNGEGRRFEQRREHTEGRFEGGNRPQAAQAPVAASAPVVARPAPVATPPMSAPAPQARTAPPQMPVATPAPPSVAHHGNPQAAVAAAPRGPENNARSDQRKEHGNRQASNDNSAANQGSQGGGQGNGRGK